MACGQESEAPHHKRVPVGSEKTAQRGVAFAAPIARKGDDESQTQWQKIQSSAVPIKKWVRSRCLAVGEIEINDAEIRSDRGQLESPKHLFRPDPGLIQIDLHLIR